MEKRFEELLRGAVACNSVNPAWEGGRLRFDHQHRGEIQQRGVPVQRRSQRGWHQSGECPFRKIRGGFPS